MQILATDGRYTVAAGVDYGPEIVAQILEALGMPFSKQAKQRWRR